MQKGYRYEKVCNYFIDDSMVCYGSDRPRFSQSTYSYKYNINVWIYHCSPFMVVDVPISLEE